jgi:hemerythrin-like domain-containing protein
VPGGTHNGSRIFRVRQEGQPAETGDDLTLATMTSPKLPACILNPIIPKNHKQVGWPRPIQQLSVLERELSVFDRGDRPNYEVVLAVIDYFKDYPDSCHHPTEDMIFEKLKARDPIAASSIGDLEAEHREGARRLRRAAQAVERVLSDQDLLRQTVADIIRDFISHERQHMAMEERVVFPAALNALQPEDWADIALKMADRDDPFYRPDFEQKFNRLRRNIREMEEEADSERAS